MPTGKHADYARQVARQFYQQRGLDEPELCRANGPRPLQNTTRYNPENGSLLTEPRPFNLMFKTYVGPVESAENIAYLRPETAQAIFAQFKNVLDVSRQKVPFGICQIGKAFRNEINPRNFTFRSREFEQMELEFFIKPDEAVEAIGGRVATPVRASGASRRTLSPTGAGSSGTSTGSRNGSGSTRASAWRARTLDEYWQKTEELAHYARATVDILFKFPFGTQELEGIAARGDFDLSQHQSFAANR